MSCDVIPYPSKISLSLGTLSRRLPTSVLLHYLYRKARYELDKQTAAGSRGGKSRLFIDVADLPPFQGWPVRLAGPSRPLWRWLAM